MAVAVRRVDRPLVADGLLRQDLRRFRHLTVSRGLCSRLATAALRFSTNSTPSRPDAASVAAHVRALSAAHAEKTKSLLKSIDRLKAEISTLRAANKEHHRSAHIRALQRRLREQELVSHVLKQSLQSSSSMSSADVDDLIIRKTVAGPLRFRPKVS